MAENTNDTLPGMSPQPMKPYVEILEEPRARGLRFRYECEGRAAGSIPGEHSTPENRTYPKIQIHNSNSSDAIVVVSAVSKDELPRPHPHSLVGKDCKKGVCTVKLKKQSLATFPNLGIQCAKKKVVVQALEDRKHLRVDPFQTGFDFPPTSFDLSTVRLCFQVFLPDSTGKFTRIVQPVVSQCIYDRKTVTDLVICRISRQAGSARGGQDVFLLCDKVNKDDIEVRFYEEDQDGAVLWEARGDFGQPDVHRQYAIVFRTPPYRNLEIVQPVTVSLQLKRPSDGEKSEPLEFTYTPIDPDPYGLTGKRAKRLCLPDSVTYPLENQMNASADPKRMEETKQKIQSRILAKPNRNRPAAAAAAATVVKKEDFVEDCMLQQYLPNHDPLEGIVYPSIEMVGIQLQPVLDGEGIPNNQTFNWSQYITANPDQPQSQLQPQPHAQPLEAIPSDNGETAHDMLNELAEGGSGSLKIDSSSLLKFLEDDTLNQFAQLDTEMS